MTQWQEQFFKWSQEPFPQKAFQLLLFDDSLIPTALSCLASSRKDAPLLIILPDEALLERTASAMTMLQPLTKDSRPIVPLPVVALARNMWIPENEAGRSAALACALSRKPAIFLSTPSVLLAQTIAPRTFEKRSFVLKKGDSISMEELAMKLVEMDYDTTLQVSVPGDFSRRGGIFDIFSPLYDCPIRLEFFGDEIDSMRFFLPDTQRSCKEAEELRIVPKGNALFAEQEKKVSTIRDFFEKDIQAVLVDPVSVAHHLLTFFDQEKLSEWDKICKKFSNPITVITDPGDHQTTSHTPSLRFSAVSLEHELTAQVPELGDSAVLWHWQQLKNSILRWNEQGYTVVACCAETGEAERLKQLLNEDHSEKKPVLAIETRQLPNGLLLPDAKLALLSSQEIFGRKNIHRKKSQIEYKKDNSLADAPDLEEGSYVVHVAQGIAIYHGIRKIETGGELQEVMELEFADEVRLFVPLEQAFLVSRYMGAGKAQPKLSKLGSAAWNKAKNSASSAAMDLAADLIKIEALRNNAAGCPMKPVLEWERSFEESFPWTETPDQAKAIQTVLQDMESPKPMDRLLCGDVGYGKTEVAVRAAFRAVLNGRQVAVLVPTTILAQQHFQTFRERMAEYPVSIDMISRFRTKKELDEIKVKAAAGEIDILIGTHALLAPSMKFRNLGLLIIDEEQRFGVKHKQQLKGMRADMDILTMSATPIPRTLYFSLAGIRNLSTIMTPPTNRLPVSTIVATYDKEQIRLAISRELERKGQVFFLYNRVKTIYDFADVIQKLVPQARCVVAHGQMSPGELEEIMTRFVRHEYDVLICTTIIESGVDMPNVNTILIDRADKFGLSELYQLRGRVGRTDRQGYAYLLLPPMGALTGDAKDRIAAIRRYTHLGAGFRLAMRDLEIRGAGNILGAEQSGHIAAIGFDLYCQLLKDAVSGLTKRQQQAKPRCQIALDRLVFALHASPPKNAMGLPPAYIQDQNQRIAFYKRINEVKTESALAEFTAELQDRFGPLPEDTHLMMEFHRLRVLAEEKGFHSITLLNGRLLVETGHGLLRNSMRELPTIDAKNGKAQLEKVLQFIRYV